MSCTDEDFLDGGFWGIVLRVRVHRLEGKGPWAAHGEGEEQSGSFWLQVLLSMRGTSSFPGSIALPFDLYKQRQAHSINYDTG